MKQIFTLLFSIIFTSTVSAFQCGQPMSYREFGMLRQQLLNTNNPNRAYQMAMDMAKTNCFTSNQVEDLATLLANDRDRLDFCKTAFRNTFDKENFEEVYDAFISFSNALRLYKFVNAQPMPNTTIITNPNPYSTTTTTITYNYPNVQQYTGKFGCNGYINEFTFRQLKQQLMMINNELGMFNAAKQMVHGYCMNVAQVMEICALFNNENMRYDLLTDAFPNVYDIDNYTFVGQLFSNQPLRDKCMNTISPNRPVFKNPNTQPPVNIPPSCAPNPNEFAEMKASIQNISFNSSRESQLKSVVRGRCFNVNQVKELLNIFSFESSKLDLAKFLYDFCNEKQNYYKVNDVFNFSSSKDDLNAYIQGR